MFQRGIPLFCLLRWASADVDNYFPVVFISNPVAQHVGYPVQANTPAVVTLAGSDDQTRRLSFFIVSLPEEGRLYETSQNYRSYGTDPKNAPYPIEEFQLPYLVTDTANRVVYIPPANVFAPDGRWSSFEYTVQAFGTNEDHSERGVVSLNGPTNNVAGSSFSAGADGWTIQGNTMPQEPSFQAYGWGSLNRYVVGTDDVHYVDFATNSDRSKWFFVAPESYYHRALAASYGGTIQFTVRATYGDFDFLNSPLDWITLDCSSCNNGKGIRIVRYVDELLRWDGSEKTVSVVIAVGHGWKRDPLNAGLPISDASECEIAAVLQGVTRLRLLGDFVQAGEGVALDDVSVSAAANQPAYPVACQGGCLCTHHPVRRMACCGN